MAQSILKRLSIPFVVSCIIGLIYNIVTITITSFNSVIAYPIELWLYSNELLDFIYPVFCTVPFCWILYYERKNGYLSYVHTRVSLKKYLSTHYLCGAGLAFATLFFISFSGAVIGIYIIQPHVVDEYPDFINANLYGTMQVYQPLLYGFLLSLWRGLIGVLMYTFSFLLSLISKHLFIILTGAFLYSILENFVTALTISSFYSICTSFDPNNMNWDIYPYAPELALMVGPLILLAICAVLAVYYTKKKGKENEISFR